MSVVVVNYAGGEISRALAIVVIAGLVQVLLGVLRLDSFVSYTPYPVVSGFTSAVGLISSQCNCCRCWVARSCPAEWWPPSALCLMP